MMFERKAIGVISIYLGWGGGKPYSFGRGVLGGTEEVEDTMHIQRKQYKNKKHDCN